jgi:hypothetical protein
MTSPRVIAVVSSGPMRGRRDVLVRLSEAHLSVVKEAAAAAGMKLESLLIGAALRFIAIDPEFRRQFRSEARVSWGPAPARFAAAELLQLDLFDAQFDALAKAASGVRYSRSGGTVDVTVAQFIVGATTRLLGLHAKGSYARLKGELGPFLGDKLPPLPALEEVPEHRGARGGPPPPPGCRATSPTVIVSSSMLGLPVVSVEEPARAGVWKAVDAPLPLPKERLRGPKPSLIAHPVDREERSERATWVPLRSPLLVGEEFVDRAEPEPEPEDPAPPSGSHRLGFDLRLGFAIGGALVLSAVGTAFWAAKLRPPPEQVALPDPRPPPEELADLPQLPGKLEGRARGSSDEETDVYPAVIGRPTLPPPPDLPEPTSNDPDVKAATKALKELTRKFRNPSNPSKDIEELLHRVYGRPQVSADGKIVQSNKIAPEHRYDVFIQRAVSSVAPVYPVPVALVKAIIKRESNFNPEAKSIAGAIGLMQVMPFNAPKVNLTVAELSEPETNILAGTRLLAVLLKYYNGDIMSALVAYNAKARPLFAPLPENGETPTYVAAVLQFLEEFKKQSPPP